MSPRILSVIVVILAHFHGMPHEATGAEVVIDFESLATPGTGFFGVLSPYTEDGFQLETPNGPGTQTGFTAFRTGDVNFPGSTASFGRFRGNTTTLTQIGGSPFDLISMEVSELFATGGVVPVTFVGTKTDTSTVMKAITLDGIFGFETVTFPGFTNLVSVKWIQEADDHQYDNIRGRPVPLPVTGWMGLALLTALGAWRATRT